MSSLRKEVGNILMTLINLFPSLSLDFVLRLGVLSTVLLKILLEILSGLGFDQGFFGLYCS